MRAILTPNEHINETSTWAVRAGWLAGFILLWEAVRPQTLPSTLEIIQAFPELFDNGAAQAIMASLSVNVQALLLSMLFSLGLAYISVVPLLAPLVSGLSKLRFVSPAALLFTLTALTHSGHELKMTVMTMGISVFFLTTMAGVVAAIPKEKFDHARTLRMTEWEIVWYVIVRGTWDQAMVAVRENAAMGWAMLMMVEGLVRAEGGIGKLILDENKHLNLATVHAAVICIIVVGLAQDFVLAQLREVLCPYVAGESK